MVSITLGSGLLAGMLGGLVGAALMFALVGFIVIYVYAALALQTIAKKHKTHPAWFAWIPILNVVLMLKMAKLSWAWVFALLVTAIPKIGSLLILAGTVYVWWRIVKPMHKPEWLAILMIVPVVNLVVLGYLAWSK